MKRQKKTIADTWADGVRARLEKGELGLDDLVPKEIPLQEWLQDPFSVRVTVPTNKETVH